MTAVGALVLVLGLLVSAHCEVRARDPEVEEEEEELGGRGGGGRGGFGTAAFPPHLDRFQPGGTETTPSPRSNYLARIGNWCAFVQKRAVMTAVATGTEQYTSKFYSRCPIGKSDCQLVLYKLANRPVYTQKQTIHTSVQWRCCPGHEGHKCEDTVPAPSSQQLVRGSEPETVELHFTDVQQQPGDPNSEQNDSELYDASNPKNQHNSTHSIQDPDHGHKPHHASHTPDHHHPHHINQHSYRKHSDEVKSTRGPYPDAPSALPVPHMMALVMSQLQPILEGFNRSLEHLSWQVSDLARNVEDLRSGQGQEAKPQATVALGTPELDEATEQRLDAKLDEVYQRIVEVQRQMDSQRVDMDNRLHSQHAMLHYNLTNFKTDIDMKLKRHQKMLQISLQAMNTTLSELKLDQDQAAELVDQLPFPYPAGAHPQPPSDSPALWEAIERLDNMVVNNTVKVNRLMEDKEVTSGNVQQLRWDLKELGKQINQTARNTQILFMETGLEVEDSKVAVLRRVEELADNVTQHNKQLQEVDVDVDYLYTALYNNSNGDCDCKGLNAAVAKLERSVANVTTLANENRMFLDKDNEAGAGQLGDWDHPVEVLQSSLQHVKESMDSQQSRTRTLEHSVAQLNNLVTIIHAEISSLKDTDRKLSGKVLYLNSSFNSLLNDTVRHSDVLELLLEEEVMEFLEWSIQDQESYSILALKKQLRNLQDEVTKHNQSLKLLFGSDGREEVPSADQPTSSEYHDDWFPSDTRRSSDGGAARERQLLFHPDHKGDGSDLWNLEKTVEELALKVVHLEEKPCPCPNASAEREPSSSTDTKLQEEVMWLKRGLEDHLKTFKNVFSNADVLAATDATLDLDKLLRLVKNKGGKEKKRGPGNHRSRRDSSGVPVPYSPSEDFLLFMAESPKSISTGAIVFKASLNWRQVYSDTGTFTAPVDGIYLFVLTLDLRPGLTHVVLRRGSSGAPVPLHRQEVTEAGPATGVALLPLRGMEELRLELREGAWAESEDNIFTGMLLHRTT